MAAYLDRKGIYDGQTFVKQKLKIKKKTIVIFALYENELPPYREFLTKQNAILLNRINGVSVYSVTLEP
jgi:hypothetical protein